MKDSIKHKVFLKRAMVGLCSASCLAGSGLVVAQEASRGMLEEVLVTATKRVASMQEVPISIAALPEDVLLNAGIGAVTDLSSMVAGLDMNNQGPGESSIAIRGIPDVVDSLFVSPTVGLYVDEIPVTGHPTRSPELSLFDAERVEVLRGPQGTLFGDGSLGGTIRVISNKPDSQEFSGKLIASYASWSGGSGNYDVNGIINIPILEDKLALRLVGSYTDDDGYIDNRLIGSLIEGQEDINKSESISIRAALRATPSEDLTFDLVYRYSDLDVEDIREEQRQGVKNRNVLEPNTNELNSLSLTISYDLGWASLVSATAYTEIDLTNAYEISDFLVPGFFEFFGATAATFDFIAQQESTTQELRLVSDSDGNLNWTVGAFYRDDTRNQLQDIFNPPVGNLGVFFGFPADQKTLDFEFDQDLEQLAFFGEIDYRLGDITVLLGGRYYEEDNSSAFETRGWITFSPTSSGSQQDSSDTFMPKIVFKYTPSESLTAYISYTEGFRAGGVNPLAESARSFGVELAESYDPENLAAVELGIKKIWMDGILRTNLFIYQNTWDDMIQPFVDPTSNFGYEGNAGEAESSGIEFELNAAPIENLNLSFSIALNDSEFQESVVDPISGIELIANGNRIPGIPEVSYSASAEYRTPIGPLEGIFRADFSHRGDTFSQVSNDPRTKTDTLDILNLRIGVNGEQWGAYLFANNVTGEDGALVSFTPLSPFTTGNIVDATFVAPQEIGVELRYSF